MQRKEAKTHSLQGADLLLRYFVKLNYGDILASKKWSNFLLFFR